MSNWKSESYNKRMLLSLIELMPNDSQVFINAEGNVGVCSYDPYISVYINAGYYHLAMSEHRYENWLTLEELIQHIADA